jgi:peroxiredoxin
VKSFLKVVIFATALVFIFKSCGPFLGTHSSLIGQSAPDFTLETLRGQEASMAQFRGGQPAMIFFWATWCPHCRRELGDLIRQGNQIERKGIKVVLVDVGESLQEVKAYFDAHEISYEVFLDRNKKVAKNYRIVGVPTFFFVNKEGNVVAAEHTLPRNYEEILLGLAS